MAGLRPPPDQPVLHPLPPSPALLSSPSSSRDARMAAAILLPRTLLRGVWGVAGAKAGRTWAPEAEEVRSGRCSARGVAAWHWRVRALTRALSSLAHAICCAAAALKDLHCCALLSASLELHSTSERVHVKAASQGGQEHLPSSLQDAQGSPQVLGPSHELGPLSPCFPRLVLILLLQAEDLQLLLGLYQAIGKNLPSPHKDHRSATEMGILEWAKQPE